MSIGPSQAATTLEDSPRVRAAVIGAAVLVGIALALTVLFADNRIVIAVALIPLALVIAVRHPFAAVIMYILAAATRPEELRLAPIFLHLERIFAIAAVVALTLPQLARRTWQPWRWARTDWGVLALGLVAGIAVPFSVSRPQALWGFLELAKRGFLYGLIRYAATSLTRLRAVVWAILVATGFTCFMALKGMAAGQVYVGERGVIRAMGMTSTTGDPNALANAIVAALPFAVVLIGAERRLATKVLYVLVAGLLLYTVALTGARGAVVSLLVGLMLMALLSRRPVLVVGAAAAALSVMWMVTPPDLKARYETLRTYQQEVTYQGRVHNIAVGLEMLRDRPLTGYGVTCFTTVRFERYDHQWSNAHNLLAQIGGEMGVLGLAAFAFFVIAGVALAWRARRMYGALGPGRDRQYQWLRGLATAALLTFAVLLVQAFGSHNLLRWNWYACAALAANAVTLARDASHAAGPASRAPSGAAWPTS
jgi:O-antigen ligase